MRPPTVADPGQIQARLDCRITTYTAHGDITKYVSEDVLRQVVDAKNAPIHEI
jgi:hypothetical protein